MGHGLTQLGAFLIGSHIRTALTIVCTASQLQQSRVRFQYLQCHGSILFGVKQTDPGMVHLHGAEFSDIVIDKNQAVRVNIQKSSNFFNGLRLWLP